MSHKVFDDAGVRAAVLELDRRMRAVTDKDGVQIKSVAVAIVRDDDRCEVARDGCDCPACAGNLVWAIMDAMHSGDGAAFKEDDSDADQAGGRRH